MSQSRIELEAIVQRIADGQYRSSEKDLTPQAVAAVGLLLLAVGYLISEDIQELTAAVRSHSKLLCPACQQRFDQEEDPFR